MVRKCFLLPVTATLPSRELGPFASAPALSVSLWLHVLFQLWVLDLGHLKGGPWPLMLTLPWRVSQSVPFVAYLPPACYWPRRCQALGPIPESGCLVLLAFLSSSCTLDEAFYQVCLWRLFFFFSVRGFFFHSLGRVFAEQTFLSVIMSHSLISSLAILAFVVSKKLSPNPSPAWFSSNDTF